MRISLNWRDLSAAAAIFAFMISALASAGFAGFATIADIGRGRGGGAAAEAATLGALGCSFSLVTIGIIIFIF